MASPKRAPTARRASVAKTPAPAKKQARRTTAAPAPASEPAEEAPPVIELRKGIRVMCRHSKLVDFRTLQRFPRNPNKHPPEQVKRLAKIIRSSGWRNPIVVSARSGFITKGHGRLDAAALLFRQTGECRVPIEVQSYVNEAEEYADIVADNRIAELSELDSSLVGLMMQDVRGTDPDFDFEMFGYDPGELAPFFDPAAGGTGDDSGSSESGDDEGGRYSAEDLQQFERYLAAGQPITITAAEGDVWRVGAHYLYVGSILWGHETYIPLVERLREEFSDRRIALVPLPEPMMLATRSEEVAAVFLQSNVDAASLTLSFLHESYSWLEIEKVEIPES